MRRELLLGCGENRDKKMASPEHPKWEGLVTVDFNGEHKPDIVHDLSILPYVFAEDNSFDEIHCYDVLEHLGPQGDFASFFNQFNEFYRILRPGGEFFCLCPQWNSVGAWGDPGHTRVINEMTISFLDRTEYGKPPRTDYRFIYDGDFEITYASNLTSGHFAFVAKVVKPRRGE